MSARADLSHITPRLLTRAEARRYCKGVDPYHVTPPLVFGRRLLWDKVALDEALSEMSQRRRSAPPPELPASANDVEGELERARKRIAKSAVSRSQ